MKNLFKKENLSYLIAVAALALLWLYVDARAKLSAERDAAERDDSLHANNLTAMKDDLETVENLVGDVMTQTASYVVELERLKLYDSLLYSEIKEVRGVVSYVNSKVSVETPRIKVDNELKRYPDSSGYGLTFEEHYKDSCLYFGVSGESRFEISDNVVYPGKTVINPTTIEVGLKYGFKEEDEKYEVFAYSPSKAVTFKNLEGALILDKNSNTIYREPDPKMFTWTLNAGAYYAPGVNKACFAVGLGLGYRIADWPFKKVK